MDPARIVLVKPDGHDCLMAVTRTLDQMRSAQMMSFESD